MLSQILLAFSMACMSIQLSFGYGLTLGRIGILALVIGLIINRRNSNQTASVSVIPFFLIAIYGMLLALITHVPDGSVARIALWVMYGVLCNLTIISFKGIEVSQYSFMSSLVLIACGVLILYSISLLVAVLGTGFALESPSTVRKAVNTLPGGLSSYFYGLYALASIGMLLAIVGCNYKNAAWFGVVFLLVTMISASRQFFIYSFLSLSMFYILTIFSKKGIRYSLIGVVSLIGLVALVSFISSQDFFSVYLGRVLNFEESYSLDDSSTNTRLDLILEGGSLFLDNPFGYGPNMHAVLLERPPHNGYVAMAIDFGIIGLLCHMLFGVGICLSVAMKRSSNRKEFFCLFVPLYFVSPMFNDVIYLAIYWVAAASIATIASKKRTDIIAPIIGH